MGDNGSEFKLVRVPKVSGFTGFSYTMTSKFYPKFSAVFIQSSARAPAEEVESLVLSETEITLLPEVAEYEEEDELIAGEVRDVDPIVLRRPYRIARRVAPYRVGAWDTNHLCIPPGMRFRTGCNAVFGKMTGKRFKRARICATDKRFKPQRKTPGWLHDLSPSWKCNGGTIGTCSRFGPKRTYAY